jgi:FkbM family methyltransferase
VSGLLRRSGYAGVKLAGKVLGRGQLARLARFVTNAVRLDVPNDMAHNGETLVVERVLQAHTGPGPAVILDCGANVGHYSLMVLRTATRLSRKVELHAFEPSAFTFARLKENLEAAGFKGGVHLHPLALSNVPADAAVFRDNRAGGGTNTLVGAGDAKGAGQEKVAVSTLDHFCERQGIETVSLLKVDTEGNDYNVLRGGQKLFADGRLQVVQFEYNHRWIYARHFLRDAFEFLCDWQYQIGKVTPEGVEFYREWHPELEKFVEGNYVACREETRSLLPRIVWWGELINIPPAP